MMRVSLSDDERRELRQRGNKLWFLLEWENNVLVRIWVFGVKVWERGGA